MASIAQDFSVLSKALDMRTQRHQALASNIANADTPNYKARDIDFKSAMQNALAGRADGGSLAMAVTAGSHLAGNGAGGPGALQYRTETQSAVDGNTVDMDVERAQFAENAIFYEAGLTFITGRIRTMLSAVQGNQ